MHMHSYVHTYVYRCQQVAKQLHMTCKLLLYSYCRVNIELPYPTISIIPVYTVSSFQIFKSLNEIRCVNYAHFPKPGHIRM